MKKFIKSTALVFIPLFMLSMLKTVITGTSTAEAVNESNTSGVEKYIPEARTKCNRHMIDIGIEKNGWNWNRWTDARTPLDFIRYDSKHEKTVVMRFTVKHKSGAIDELSCTYDPKSKSVLELVSL